MIVMPIRTMICIPVATCRCVIRIACPLESSALRFLTFLRVSYANRRRSSTDSCVRNRREITTASRPHLYYPQFIPKKSLHIHRLSTIGEAHGCAIMGLLTDDQMNLTGYYVKIRPGKA